MKNHAIVELIEGEKGKIGNLPEIIPNIIESAIFQAKINTNGKKQIKIKMHTDELKIFVCNGGHSVSSKEFSDLKFSNYKIRIIEKRPVLMFEDTVLCNFLEVPIENDIIYWVSWETKRNRELSNRSDVFCLLEGELTNKLLTNRNKINKKYTRKK